MAEIAGNIDEKPPQVNWEAKYRCKADTSGSIPIFFFGRINGFILILILRSGGYNWSRE